MGVQEVGVKECSNAVNCDQVVIANDDIGVRFGEGEGEHGEVVLDGEELGVGGPSRLERIGVKRGERHGS